MIIKGNIRTDGKALGNYLLSEGRYEKNFDKNEKIEIWEATGVQHGDTLQEILKDFQRSATGTQCEKPLFHVAIRLDEDESLTREQWLEGINRLEKRLELEGHERVIVTHNLNGHEHVHVVWNRIDHEQRKAAELHYYKHKCTDLARELEKEFGLRELSNDRKQGRLSRDEEQQAIRHGQDPQKIKETLRECWKQADNGKSFAAALKEQGYQLAQGDRRDFVIVGPEGDVYGVARETGSKAADVRAKLSDLDRENMPTVAEAKELQLDRATTRDLLKWEDELAKAAIAKAQREELRNGQEGTDHKDLSPEFSQKIELENIEKEDDDLQTEQLADEFDKGLKIVGHILGGVTKPIEGVLDFLVGETPDTPEQKKQKVEEKKQAQKEATEDKEKTVENRRQMLFETYAAQLEEIKKQEREGDREKGFGGGRERER